MAALLDIKHEFFPGELPGNMNHLPWRSRNCNFRRQAAKLLARDGGPAARRPTMYGAF